MSDMLAFTYSRTPPPPKMPPGLRELMEELTREVLRHGPEDVHGFCANHMKKLLEIRDGPRKMRPLTLKEKQARAQKILRHRAELRKKKIDKQKNEKKCDPEEENLKAPVLTENYLKEGLELELFDEDSKFIERPAFFKDVLPFEDCKKEETPIEQQIKEDKVYSNESVCENNDVEKNEPVMKNNISLKVESDPLLLETKVDEVDNTGSQFNNAVSKTEDVLENEDTVQSTQNDEKDTLKASSPLQEHKVNPECEITENKEEQCNVIVSENIEKDNPTDVDVKLECGNVLDCGDNEKSNLVQETESTGINVNSIQATETVEASNMKTIIPKLEEIATHTHGEISYLESSNNKNVEIQAITNIKESDESKKQEETLTADINELKKTDIAKDEIKKDDDNIQTVTVDDLEDMKTDIKNNTENTEDFSSVDNKMKVEKLVADTGNLKEEDVTKSTGMKEDSTSVNTNDVIADTVTKRIEGNIEDASSLNANPVLSTVADVEDLEKELLSNSIEHLSALDVNNSDKQIVIFHDKNPTEIEEVTGLGSVNTTDIGDLTQILEIESDGKQEQDHDQISIVKKKEDCIVGENSMTQQNILSNEIIIPGNGNEESVHTENLQYDISSGNDDTVQESLSGDDSQSIGHTTMDLETAAVTIQKVFRCFLFKNRNSTFDDGASDESTIDKDNIKEEDTEFLTSNEINKERRTLGLSRMDSVLQTVNEEKSLSLSTDDSSTLSSAATTIQAHVRGFLVRNKLSSEKTTSTNSLGNSNPSESTDIPEQAKSKTILNIHIVPESGHFVSRDDSLLASIDLSMDGSPRASSNLHPLGYDKSERRKQLKREDAIQSVSPPSNNSGKLSEDVDSVKEMPLADVEPMRQISTDTLVNKEDPKINIDSRETTPTLSVTEDTVKTAIEIKKEQSVSESKSDTLAKVDLDESDVVTPLQDDTSSGSGDLKLLHSGEFHDAVLPTKVSRNDSVIRGE